MLQGETFVSETDTEVIPKLCRYVYAKLAPERMPLAEVRRAAGLEGSPWCASPSGDAPRPLPEKVLGGRRRESCLPGSWRRRPPLSSLLKLKLPPPTPTQPPPRLQLVMDVMSQLEGAYALLVKSTCYPGEMVACKRGSPLILGVRAAPPSPGVRPQALLEADAADGSRAAGAPALECFLASDASAVVEHTKR